MNYYKFNRVDPLAEPSESSLSMLRREQVKIDNEHGELQRLLDQPQLVMFPTGLRTVLTNPMFRDVRFLQPKVLERMKKFLNEMEKIDHSNRKPYCSGMKVVYDISAIPSTAVHGDLGMNPCDPIAPYGVGYFDNVAWSPLIQICDHKDCQKDSELLYFLVLAFNVDGTPGERAPKTRVVPWKVHRRSHSSAQDVMPEFRKLVEMKREDREKLPEDFYRTFIKKYLFATQRMGYAESPMEEELLDVVHHIESDGWAKRINSWLKVGFEIGERFLMEAMSYVKHREMFWSPIFSTIIGNYHPHMRPLNVVDSWITTNNWFGGPPAAFYLSPCPDDYNYALCDMKRPLNERELIEHFKTTQNHFRHIRKRRYLLDAVNNDDDRPENLRISCSIKSFDPTNAIRVFFRKYGEMGRKEREFCFLGAYYEYAIESIFRIIFLTIKDQDVLIRELEYSKKLLLYTEGKCVFPKRADFGLGDLFSTEFCSIDRYADKGWMARFPIRDGFAVNFCEGYMEITSYRAYSKEKFTLTPVELLYIFHKMLSLIPVARSLTPVSADLIDNMIGVARENLGLFELRITRCSCENSSNCDSGGESDGLSSNFEKYDKIQIYDETD